MPSWFSFCLLSFHRFHFQFMCLKCVYIYALQGILGILSAILGNQFFLECYNPLGEILDIMALTNSAANFILYCLMSSQFWMTLNKLFGIKPRQERTVLTFKTKFRVRANKHRYEYLLHQWLNRKMYLRYLPYSYIHFTAFKSIPPPHSRIRLRISTSPSRDKVNIIQPTHQW